MPLPPHLHSSHHHDLARNAQGARQECRTSLLSSPPKMDDHPAHRGGPPPPRHQLLATRPSHCYPAAR
eukprot:6641410-Heterocapsa_arctica.AAC.1